MNEYWNVTPQTTIRLKTEEIMTAAELVQKFDCATTIAILKAICSEDAISIQTVREIVNDPGYDE